MKRHKFLIMYEVLTADGPERQLDVSNDLSAFADILLEVDPDANVFTLTPVDSSIVANLKEKYAALRKTAKIAEKRRRIAVLLAEIDELTNCPESTPPKQG